MAERRLEIMQTAGTGAGVDTARDGAGRENGGVEDGWRWRARVEMVGGGVARQLVFAGHDG